MITRPPLESELQSLMALGPDRLQQKYAMKPDTVTLIALQKTNNQIEANKNAIQASMQTNPATVKNQLEQRAIAANREGIASMLPGIQMQGQRMAQAQARQAAGIPSQPAPNMARMAGGGIVGFQEGGMPRSDAESIAYDMLSIERQMGKPGKTEEELKQLDTRRLELSARMANDPTGNLRADVYKTMDVIRAGGADRLHLNNTIQQMPIGGFTAKLINYLIGGGNKSEAKEDDAFVGPTKDMLKGMYGGGVVAFQEGGLLSEEELRRVEETIANRPTNTPPSYMSSAQRRAQLEAETAASKERNAEMKRRREELLAMGLTIPEVNAFLEGEATQAPKMPEMPDEELESILSMMKDPNDYSPQKVPTRETLNRYEEGEGDASTVMGQTSVDDILAEMESISTPADQSTDPSVDVRGLTNLITDYGEGVLDPGYAESQRSARQGEAQKAYAVPEELRQLYEERQTELESLKRTPEDIRNRELAALLGGLASSPYIARSGTQAYRGMQKVGDEARQENIATAEKSFGMAKELANLDRTASMSAFKEGLTALSEANSAQMVGLQTVNNMIQGVQNRELQGKLSQQSNKLQTLQAQFQNELKKIDVAADIDRTRQTNIRELYKTAESMRSDLIQAKTELEAMLGVDPEAKARIGGIYDAQIRAATDTTNSLASLLDLGTGTASGAPTTSTLSEADSIVGVE